MDGPIATSKGNDILRLSLNRRTKLAYAASGFAGALTTSGGDFKSAAAGALTGGMFGFAGSLGGAGKVSGQMAMHAAAGCASGALGGGGAEGCARGAIAQSLSKMVTIETRDIFKGNVVAHGVIASVSGGTVSAMTGGKFANGAITGAFRTVLNEMGQIAQAERSAVRHALSANAVSSAGGGPTPRTKAGFPTTLATDLANAKGRIENWAVTSTPVSGNVMGIRQSSFWERAGHRLRNKAHVGIYIGPQTAVATSLGSGGRVLSESRMWGSGWPATYRTFVGSNHSERFYGR